jgi:quinol-cytochrome oxidoreductase complex cytochrome b subunit
MRQKDQQLDPKPDSEPVSPKAKKEFYPDYLTEILIVIILCAEVLFLLVWAFPPQIGREIDFVRQYQPRPEWYFLWVFELLKYFHGNWAIFGAVLIPLAMAMIIVFLPLFDRKIGRKVTAVIATALFLVFVILTISGMYRASF